MAGGVSGDFLEYPVEGPDIVEAGGERDIEDPLSRSLELSGGVFHTDHI